MADEPLAPESPAPPAPPAKPLSLKEQRFVDELLICGVQAEAARRAGYSRKGAREAGREVAARPHVAAEIQRRRQELAERAAEDQERILADLRREAFFDLGDVFEFHGRSVRLRPGKDIPAHARVVLAGIKVKRISARGQVREVPMPAPAAAAEGASSVTVSVPEEWEVLEFKLPDRQKAKELLGRHYGMFAETHRHVGAGGGPIETVSVTLTEEERATRVAQLLETARARRDGA